jgi:hypothetical protein
MTDDLQVIRIKRDLSITVDVAENGITAHKVISPQGLENALMESMINTDTKSGILPKNCIAWTKSSRGNAEYYVIRHDERFADIQYHETKYPHFPIPQLVFGFRISGNRITGVNAGVVEAGSLNLNEDTQMYRYPFSNVNGFDMCTGGNRLPIIKKAAALANLPYYILSLPDNDDYYSANHNKLNLGHRELLEHLKDKSSEYYYTDVLIPSGRKLKDFI